MANKTTPAQSNGGRTAAPATTSSDGRDIEGSLPDRLRVHALAKLLSVSSKEVMAALSEVGTAVRSAQSSIDRATALRALQVLLPEPGPDPMELDEVVGTPMPPTLDLAARPPVPDAAVRAPVFNAAAPVFLPPAPQLTTVEEIDFDSDDEDEAAPAETGTDEAETDAGTRRRRRRGRRGRGRGKAGGDTDDGGEQDDSDPSDESAENHSAENHGAEASPDEETSEGVVRRRRRRRRRRDGSDDVPLLGEDDPPDTVVHVRESKLQPLVEDEVQSIRGSTRLEAKRQRRRDGREAPGGNPVRIGVPRQA
jgi:ribonuclease E